MKNWVSNPSILRSPTYKESIVPVVDEVLEEHDELVGVRGDDKSLEVEVGLSESAAFLSNEVRDRLFQWHSRKLKGFQN